MNVRQHTTYLAIVICFFSVTITAFLLMFIIDKNQRDMMQDQIDFRVERIVEFVENNPEEEILQNSLRAFLITPAKAITITDASGEAIYHEEMRPAPERAGQTPPEEEMTDSISEHLLENGWNLQISLEQRPEQSFLQRALQSGLIGFYILIFILSFLIALIPAIFVSRRISRGLEATARMASSVLLDEQADTPESGIDEIATITGTLQDLSDRLKMKQQSRKTLIDELIHQSRTPLTVMKFHIEAYEDGLIELNEKEIATMHREIDNLNSIITNMSGMIDANRESDSVNLETVDISMLVHQIASSLDSFFSKRKLTVFENIEPKLITKTDKYQLGQAVYNLLTNAGKYSPMGKDVTIDVKEDNDSIMIRISDTGIGIAGSELESIFEAYYRGLNSGEKEGDGLGLYLVRDHVERLGGTVIAESVLNEGSTFTIRLPMS